MIFHINVEIEHFSKESLYIVINFSKENCMFIVGVCLQYVYACSLNKHFSDVNQAIDNEWHAVKVKRKRNVEVSSQREFSIPLENRFEGMPIDKEFMKLVLNSIPLILR